MTVGEAAAPSWEEYKKTLNYQNLYYSVHAWTKSYFGDNSDAADHAERVIYYAFIQGYVYGTRVHDVR